MSVVETQIHETEDERVARWRLEQLTRAGYEETAALVLADMVDIDLHLAVDLVRQGCPSDTALRILL
ncbi:MAG TPA: hypothetical protein VFU84_06205 [Gaiellaceae bacterium]|nr:hypothetical protein [Gaiellaceae bacterium]